MPVLRPRSCRRCDVLRVLRVVHHGHRRDVRRDRYVRRDLRDRPRCGAD